MVILAAHLRTEGDDIWGSDGFCSGPVAKLSVL